MRENVHDQMVLRTRKLIRDTLMDLIEEKGFEGVTVRNLTLNAKINRGTFYLHYRDKYDLMDNVQNEILHGLQNKLKHVNIMEAISCFSKDITYPPLVQVFQYLKDHGRFLKILLGPKGDPSFSQKIKNLLKSIFYEKMQKNIIILPENISLVQKYLPSVTSSAYFGIIEQWLESDMPHSPEEVASIFLKIINLIRVQTNNIIK